MDEIFLSEYRHFQKQNVFHSIFTIFDDDEAVKTLLSHLA